MKARYWKSCELESLLELRTAMSPILPLSNPPMFRFAALTSEPSFGGLWSCPQQGQRTVLSRSNQVFKSVSFYSCPFLSLSVFAFACLLGGPADVVSTKHRSSRVKVFLLLPHRYRLRATFTIVGLAECYLKKSNIARLSSSSSYHTTYKIDISFPRPLLDHPLYRVTKHRTRTLSALRPWSITSGLRRSELFSLSSKASHSAPTTL